MKKYIIIFGIGLTLFSCRNSNYILISQNNNPTITIDRFEEDLFSIPLNNIPEGIEKLNEKYGDFPEFFSREIISIGSTKNELYPDYLKLFLTDRMTNKLFEEVKTAFSDLSDLENSLSSAFGYYQYYFPETKIPKVFTYISGFNQTMAITNSGIGIGLDKHLGANHPFYKELGYENYIMRTLTRENIPTDCLKALALSNWPFDGKQENLLNEMLYNGKISFFLKSMFPESQDSLIMGFTKDQIKFCENNEQQMWLYLVENKLLFSSEMLTLRKFINDAPFTKDFTNESPGKAAIWLGWKIVESYMKENSEVKLDQLMKMNDYQEILKLSNYNP